MPNSDFFYNVRGVPIMKAPWMAETNIIDTLDYVPHDGDVIICSYPKTGTSWLQYIFQQIISKGDTLPYLKKLYTQIIPWMEVVGIGAVEALQEPRIYKHHFSQNDIPIRDNAKYVYIYRNPEDVFISSFHFFSEIFEGQSLNVDDFLEDFLKGRIFYGNYCDHVLSYLSHENRDNMLFVKYENLIWNRKEEILKIARFLGEEYYQDLKGDASMLDTIVEHTEFEYMKKNVFMTLPEWNKEISMKKELDGIKSRKVNYFRKGTVGDGRNSLTEAQLKRFREHVSMKVEGTHLMREWLPEECFPQSMY